MINKKLSDVLIDKTIININIDEDSKFIEMEFSDGTFLTIDVQIEISDKSPVLEFGVFQRVILE